MSVRLARNNKNFQWRRRTFEVACTALLAMGFSPFSVSQEVSDLSALLDMPLSELVNITVTSRKREEKLQAVPISVTALDQQELENWQIDSIFDLQPFVPGLQMGRTGQDPRPAIRGVRTEQVENNDTTLAIYQDGVYRSRHAQASIPYIDLERIEVMRGPQGTLFGRNSFGGVLQMVSVAPKLDSNDFSIDLTAGSHNHKRVNAMVNLGVTESLGLRFSGLREMRAPLIEGLFSDETGMRDTDSTLARSQLKWQVNPKASASFMYQYWRENANGSGLFGNKILGIPLDTDTNLVSPETALIDRVGRDDICESSCGRYGAGKDYRQSDQMDTAARVVNDPFAINSDYVPSTDILEQSFLGRLDYDLEIFDLMALGSRTDFSDKRFDDGDFSVYPSAVQGYQLNSLTDSLEFQFTSKNNYPLRWLGGLYYLNEDMNYAFLWQDLVDLEENKPADGVDPKNEWASWMSQLRVDTKSYAVFGSVNYDFSANWSSFLGARYSYDIRSWNDFGQDASDLTKINFNQKSLDQDEHKSWNQFTWNTGIEYSPRTNTMIYGMVSTGFLAGNYKEGMESYDEQDVMAYEIGSKNLFFDESVRINGSLYLNKYSNLLSTSFTDDGGTGVSIGKVGNSGSIGAYGMEFQLDWYLLDGLHLGLLGEWSRAEYEEFEVPNGFVNGVNDPNTSFQLNSEQVALSPDISGTFIVSYDWRLNDFGMIQPGLLTHYSGDYRAADQLYGFADQQSYVYHDLHVNWRSQGKHWRAQFFVKNLTNEAILVRGNRFGGNVAAGEYADPMTLGLELSCRLN